MVAMLQELRERAKSLELLVPTRLTYSCFDMPKQPAGILSMCLTETYVASQPFH